MRLQEQLGRFDDTKQLANDGRTKKDATTKALAPTESLAMGSSSAGLQRVPPSRD